MLKFSNVSKIFGETVAIDDIDFGVDEHDFLLITGPSGSGKTTLMKLLIREYLPSKGEIFYLGNPINKIPYRRIPQHRREIGVVFQDYKLLPDYNIWENIALPLYIANKNESEIEQRVTDLLKLVKLTDKALVFPSQLSGGEAQRISIARALATGPKLIFADEPTGNLDPAISLEITELLQKINKLGTTVLLATHDKVVLDSLNKVRKIRLEKGKLIEDTNPRVKIDVIVSKEALKTESNKEKAENKNKAAENKDLEKTDQTETAKTKDGEKSEKTENKKIKIKTSKIKKPISETKDKKPETDLEKTDDDQEENSATTEKKTRAILGIKKIGQLFRKK